MTAKEVAEVLLKHPEWEVRFTKFPRGKKTSRLLTLTMDIEEDDVFGFVLVGQ